MFLLSSLLKCSILCILFVTGLADPECSEPISNRLRLKKDLLCGYDRTVRPVKLRSDRVRVAVKFTPIFVTYDEEYHHFELRSQMEWVWKDEFLVWDPSRYDGVKILFMDNTQIWIPEIYQKTSEYILLHDIGGWNSFCTVNSNGWVNCSNDPTFYISCAIDLTNWPYDYQNCNFKIASLLQSEEKIELEIIHSDVISLYAPSQGWELLKVTIDTGNFEFAHKIANYIQYNLLFKRKAAVIEAAVIYPLIVLSILILSSFWIGMEPEARMNLLFSALICHPMIIYDIGYLKSASGIPNIVLFFRDSIFLNVISLLIAAFIEWINKEPPAAIPTAINFILESQPAQLILLSERRKHPKGSVPLEEEPDDDVKDATVSPLKKNWSDFATLIDRICFVIFTLIYIILGFKYIVFN